MAKRFWIETLGCPKNQVDSDKIAGSLLLDGYLPADSAEEAELVVVNTCAFIEPAREESVETILGMAARRNENAQLVVTGCLAARAGEELAREIPEIDAVVDVGVPVQLRTGPRWRPAPDRRTSLTTLDFLELPRPAATTPWAYVKVAEGCDRKCGFCAIPSFRGPQKSRSVDAILAEVDSLQVKEIVLVSQDLASYGKDLGNPGQLSDLVRKIRERTERVRLLYLYPSSLTDGLIETIVEMGLPYFDLSLQHVSRPLVKKMRRFGEGTRFLERIEFIRSLAPEAALRSSFICGYPGETEEDHDALLSFIEEAQLDWAGFFSFSEEDGTYAADLPDKVPTELAFERLREASALQDEISASRRSALIGTEANVLVDARGVARSHREAPEIDGVINVPASFEVGSFQTVRIVDAVGPDLVGELVEDHVHA